MKMVENTFLRVESMLHCDAVLYSTKYHSNVLKTASYDISP
jgi:hypothetical protein